MQANGWGDGLSQAASLSFEWPTRITAGGIVINEESALSLPGSAKVFSHAGQMFGLSVTSQRQRTIGSPQTLQMVGVIN
jgi:hypothetical protein